MNTQPKQSDLDTYNIKHIAYAQNAEDIVLLRAFGGQKKGFYVDVGAGDPTRGSLTKNLYDNLQWSGINIEPNPITFERLRSARPRDINLACGVGDRTQNMTFTAVEDNWGLSTFDTKLAKHYRQIGLQTKSITVPIRLLDDILDEYKPKTIDLLKIDVEGLEEAVVKSFSFQKWRPRVIVIEATAPTRTKQTHGAWEHVVLQAGYQLALFDGLNRFYGQKTDTKLLEQLAIPANVFDRFILERWWSLLKPSL